MGFGLNTGMEILTTITALLSIVDTILNIKTRLKSDDKKSDLASWLLDISVLLQGIARDFKNDIYPHQKCGQLHYFLMNMNNTIYDELSEEEALYLKNLIEEAYQIEKLFGEIQHCTPEQKALNLHKLEESSGVFLAASKTVNL